MIQQLGNMLFNERKRIGETQEKIADGIINISVMCRVERGEKEIDYYTLQALFERMGKSIDKLELAVSCDEYDAISYRTNIEHSIEKSDYESLCGLISKYDMYNDIKRPIHKQYLELLQALAGYIKNTDYAVCLQKMENALNHTMNGDWRQNVSAGKRFCNQEIRIIFIIVYCQWKLGDTEGLAEDFERFGRYIQSHFTDSEERVKVYPQYTWLLGQLYLEQNKVEEAFKICRTGIQMLAENGALNPLWQLLRLEQTCLEQMGKSEKLPQCRKYQEAVSFLYETAGEDVECDMMALFLKSSFQGEFVITNELVREMREANGLSQEKLSGGICSQETLSRIENENRSPNKKKLYGMLKKMGMERENYYGFIESDRYEIYEKVRQYNRCFSKCQNETAAKLLDEIETNVDMTLPVNRQFVRMGRICENLEQKKLSFEQANRQLKELLRLTMPQTNSNIMIYRVPFRTEYMIWNTIALNLRKSGKVDESLVIYGELMSQYKKSRVQMRHHAVPGMTLYMNYAGFLEANNELEKSQEIAIEGLHHCLECCRGDIAGDILANLSLVYGKQGLPEAEEKYLRYGCYLDELYGRVGNLHMLEKAYHDRFGKDVMAVL